MIAFPLALTRLAIALVLGALIGIEREWRHKTAGIKTNTLVALGAATFAMLSNTFGADNHNPAQIAAAVVTGIGFIGAGVIIHRGATVQGVTTAATLWANAAMGLAAGLGQLNAALSLFAAIILTQFTMRKIGTWIDRARAKLRVSRVDLHIDCDRAALEPINNVWARFEQQTLAKPMRRGLARANSTWTWRMTFVVTAKEPLDLGRFEEEIAAIEGVRHIEAKFVGYEEEPDAVM